MVNKINNKLMVVLGSTILVFAISMLGLSGCGAKNLPLDTSNNPGAATEKNANTENAQSANAPESTMQSTSSVDASSNVSDEKAVRTLVESFGKVLKNVLLDAPDDEIIKNMEANYAKYVTPELLASWEGNPSVRAAGRFASSAWPDHIEISTVVKNADSSYSVTGTLVEVTSDNAQGGSIASTRSADIKVIISDGKWLISECFFGEAVPANKK